MPMQDPSGAARAVARHYTRGDLAERIFEALRKEGKDVGRLHPEDLWGIDQFHAGSNVGIEPETV